jgi:hypothetical protein
MLIAANPEDIDSEARSSKRWLIIFLALAVIVTFGIFKTTLAANININSGTPVEFGQGITGATSCSGSTSLIITPYSSFTNAGSQSGSFKFSSVKISNIPSGCYGFDFTLSAFNGTSGSSALSLFNTSKTDAVVYDNNGTFSGGVYSAGLSVTTNSSSSFTATFDTPTALATTVYKLTIQSSVHTAVTCATGGTCSLGDTGPGGGIVFLLASGGGNGLNYEIAKEAVGGYTNLINWCNLTNTTIAGARGSSVGTGKANTVDMLAGCTSGAAYTATSYRGNGFSDWFLPAFDELSAARPYARTYLTTVGWTGFERIWTSTEQPSNSAYAYFIGLDAYSNPNDGKQQTYQIVPIRTFN